MSAAAPCSWRALIGALCACTLIAACSALPPASGIAAVARQPLVQFELEGRISATDGERAANGQIEWRHTPDSDQWTAYSPLGQILGRLDSSAAGAELVLANGQHQAAPSAATLLPELLGTAVPLEHLPGWVQASPGPGAEVRTVDPHGRPALVIDQGWRIDYAEYHSISADALPRRLEMSRGDARIRLVIDQWHLTP